MPYQSDLPADSWFYDGTMADIEKLGRYDIIRVLGKGAMGVVYEGRDPNLDRRVAIKTIRIQSMTPEAAAEYDGRFRTEARSAARLHHPNIVSVFDSGQDDDITYLVMEFIMGEDLKHHLECGARFSVRASIVMVHELLMALDHAHRQNVVHRDIKPANMLIELSGRVKLTDFGVARIQEPDETHLTQVGGAVGTPKYMSPEQAKGLRGDSRSDVFSAAVVLYELLTGKLPFEGENQFVVIHQIVSHDPAPPSTVNPEVPKAMDEVMARAMAKNPDERYATAREFGLALRVVAQQMTASAEGQSPDVAAELGQFLANRQIVSPPSMRDGSSTGIFGPVVDVSLSTTVNHEAELEVWSKVKDATEPAPLRKYLEQFPTGIYARRAQHRLDQLAMANTNSQAETQPFVRSVPPQDDPDSTIGPFPSTMPMVSQFPSDLMPLSSKEPEVAVSLQKAGQGKGQRWLFLALGGIALGLLIAFYVMLRPSGSVVADSGSKAAALPEEVILEQSKPSVVTPAMPASAAATDEAAAMAAAGASKSTSAASSKVVAPTLGASAKSAVPPTGASQAASKPAAAKPKASATVSATAPVATVDPPAAPVAPSVLPPRAGGPGPSQAGQPCADRIFVFKIACIAEQCGKDKYSQSQECVRFREMDRQREEQRKNQR